MHALNYTEWLSLEVESGIWLLMFFSKYLIIEDRIVNNDIMYHYQVNYCLKTKLIYIIIMSYS